MDADYFKRILFSLTLWNVYMSFQLKYIYRITALVSGWKNCLSNSKLSSLQFSFNPLNHVFIRHQVAHSLQAFPPKTL